MMCVRLLVVVCLVFLGSSQSLHLPADDLDQELPQSHNQIANIETDANPREEEEEEEADVVYAFSAEMSSAAAFLGGDPMVFDETVTNEGGLYNESNGQFQCVDDSVYVFTWTANRHGSSGSNDRCTSALKLGNHEVKFGPKTNYHYSTSGGTSLMSAVVQCRTSPRTAVTVNAATYNCPYCYYSREMTSFSGFRLARPSDAVAFTAELSADVNIYPGTRIIFDDPITNIGDHYTPAHGFFRCPRDGLYVFTVTTHTPYTSEASMQWSSSRLVVDGEIVALGPLTYPATSTQDSGSSSITVALELEAGQDVWVEANQAYNFQYGNVYGAQLTSFTGFYLNADSNNNNVAFSAVLSHNHTSAGYVVLDKVLSNAGRAYNPSTGEFTCPDDAFYMFIYGGVNDIGSTILYLHLNGNAEQGVYFTYTSTANTPRTSGNAAQARVLRCSTGDLLQLYRSGTFPQLAEYTIFTGFRLPYQQ